MAFKNQVTESVQLKLSLEESVEEKEVLSYEDDELLTLLEEILTEVFLKNEEEESLPSMEGNSIYDLADEKEISNREKFDREALNEGWPEVENLGELEQLSRAYFLCPSNYPLDEDDFEPNHVTGFIQLYSGEKFDTRGQMKEVWKSIDKKVIVSSADLMDPEKIISIIESFGIKWGPIFRIVFYGAPLVDLIGSRFYDEREARELLPLTDQHPNILLALPDYAETEEFSESIYDWMDQQFQEGILLGRTPDVHRVTSGHHELTAIRLQEVYEEELEEKTLFHIVKKENLSVIRKNQFIETYDDARKFIKAINEGGKRQDDIYSLSLKTLEDILFLCARSFDRINDPFIFSQIRSLATKMKVNSFQADDSRALMIIQKINGGEEIEAHLLSITDLESIFGILWSNIGIRIIPQRKDVYFNLKERLRVLRAKLRTPNKGRAG